MTGFQNGVVGAANGDFSQRNAFFSYEENGLLTNGQLWIGSTALNVGDTHVNVGTITSPNGSVTIGYSSPNITLQASGSVATTYQANSGVAVPVANILQILGATVAAGTSPLVTSGAANIVTINAQLSQAIAAADATKVGLSNFNSAQFSVDANGFVSSLGAGFAWIDQGTSTTAAINKGYFCTAAIALTLPASPSQGDVVKVIADTTGAVAVTANTGQTIRQGNQASSSAGTFTSTLRGDALELIYRASTTQWIALNGQGTFLVA